MQKKDIHARKKIFRHRERVFFNFGRIVANKKILTAMVVFAMIALVLTWRHFSSKFALPDILPPSPYSPSPVPTQEEIAAITAKAENGDAVSQLYLGVFFANGDKVKQDFHAAAKWYRKAAMGGNATAQYYLGFLYESGIGVERDLPEAFKWYMKAVEQDDPAAHLGIAGFHFACRKSYMPRYFGNYDVWRAKAIVLAGITSSDPSYEENFWNVYNKKLQYYQNDNLLVNAMLEQAKNDRDGETILQLARVAFHAQGIARNHDLGNRLLQIAAIFRSSNAQFILGAASEANNLIEICKSSYKRTQYLKEAANDLQEPYYAIYYYHKKLLEPFLKLFDPKIIPASQAELKFHEAQLTKLAQNGYVEAQHALVDILSRDDNKIMVAYFWAEKAAKNGNYKAAAFVGTSFLYGRGVKENFELGCQWLDKAIETNDARILHTIYRNLGDAHNCRPVKTKHVQKMLKYGYEKGRYTCALYLGLLLEWIKNPEYFNWYVSAVKKKVHLAAVIAKTIANTKEMDLTQFIEELSLKYPSISDFKNLCFENANNSLICVPGAMDNYGPAISIALRAINPDRKSMKKINMVNGLLNKLFNHVDWYNINGYIEGDVSRTLYEVNTFKNRESVIYSLKKKDSLNPYYHF